MEAFLGKDGYYHYLYRIDNKVNGKFYYGIHSTNNLEDGYMGSGTILRAAKRKYGLENFNKTILEYCNSREELEQLERETVTREVCLTPDCYNLCEGGRGGMKDTVFLQKGKTRTRVPVEKQGIYETMGWSKQPKKVSQETVEKIKVGVRAAMSEELRIQRSISTRKVWQKEGYRERMSLAHVGNEPGNKGRVMVTDGIRDRYVSEEEITSLETGWHIGMSDSARNKRFGNTHHKGKVVSKEGRENISKGHMGKRWISKPDTLESTAVSPGKAKQMVEHEGWVYGRLNYPKTVKV